MHNEGNLLAFLYQENIVTTPSTSNTNLSPDLSNTNTDANTKISWWQSVKVYRQPAALRMLLLGFAAGLPIILVFGTLSFWLSEAKLDIKTIGHVGWIGLIYGFKFVWSPLVDRVSIPFLTPLLGRRRSWLILSQGLIIAGLLWMGHTDPLVSLSLMVAGALLVAFGSATQDIALDAYRIESADTDMQAALAATYMAGYRLGMIWAGGIALKMAAHFDDPLIKGYQLASWQSTYTIMAISMAVGVLTVLFSKEPKQVVLPPSQSVSAWLNKAFFQPFQDFFVRVRWYGLLILLFIAIYRISDVVMGFMANPFYVEMGYTKDEVGTVVKTFGVGVTIAGALLGGILVKRFGVFKILTLGAVLSALTNLLFAWMSVSTHSYGALVGVITADNLSAGIATAAFIAYLSGLTNVAYSATQYALFSSVMVLLPKFLGGFSGNMVASMGFTQFFIMTAFMGVPVLFILYLVTRMPLHNSSSKV